MWSVEVFYGFLTDEFGCNLGLLTVDGAQLSFQTGLARAAGVQGDRGPVALQRDDVQQHAEKGQTEPGPAVLLPGGRAARALRQRSRLSGRLVRVRKDYCQGNPSNYDRLTIIIITTITFET